MGTWCPPPVPSEINGVRIEARDGPPSKMLRRQDHGNRGSRRSSWSTRPLARRCVTPKNHRGEDHVEGPGSVLLFHGHIEAMANAVARGPRQAERKLTLSAVPELVPEEIGAQIPLQARSGRPNAKVEDLADPRRDHHRRRHAVWAVCRRKWPISSTRLAVFGHAERCMARSAARSPRPPRNMRARDDAVLDHHQSLALRHGGRRPRLRGMPGR